MNAYLHYFGLETFRLSVWLVLLAVVFVPLERLTKIDAPQDPQLQALVSRASASANFLDPP